MRGPGGAVLAWSMIVASAASCGGGGGQAAAPVVAGCSDIKYGGETFKVDCQGKLSFDLTAFMNDVELPPLKVYCRDGCISLIETQASTCLNTYGCVDNGLCTYAGGKCVADAASCAASEGCKSGGLCMLAGGRCVGSQATCAATDLCRLLGQCQVSPTSGKCVAGGDPDCNHPDGACATYGYCHAVDGRCVAATPEECRAASSCGFAGSCTLVDGECQAETDADCATATICTSQQRCKAHEGSCSSLRTCATTCDCPNEERCKSSVCVYDYTTTHAGCP